MRNNWYPFQSPEMREICTHMSDPEKSGAMIRGGLYGIWVFATLAVPLSNVVGGRTPWLSLSAALVLLHIACLPLWFRMQRRFFCSTSWAQVQGFTPEKLRLYAFRK
jgi:hypothetical protein